MNTLYKNSLLYLLATLSVKAASFILLPFYSYLISPAEYGYIYIVISFVSFMSIMMTFSVSASISRFYIDCKGIVEVKKMFSTIVYTVVGYSLILGSSLLYFHEEIAFWLNIPSLYLVIAIISSILSCFYLLITNLLYIRQEAKKISLTSMGMGILQIVVQLSMVLSMNDKAFAMICSQLICALVTFVIFIVYSKSYLVFSYDRRKVYVYVKYALSQFPSDVSVWLLSFSDRMMMNKMQGNIATGVYGMGQTLGSIPKIIFSSIKSTHFTLKSGCFYYSKKETLLFHQIKISVHISDNTQNLPASQIHNLHNGDIFLSPPALSANAAAISPPAPHVQSSFQSPHPVHKSYCSRNFVHNISYSI